MIEVKKYTPKTAEHFDPEGNSLGFLNELENLDLRAQISEQNVDGYYLMFEGKKITINENGEMSDWPTGLWDTMQNLFARLFMSNRLKQEEKEQDNMEALAKVQLICDGIEYSRDVPQEAKDIAKENNIVIIVGGSDDLMYCYGADSYLTDYCEHGYGWDGSTLTDIGDKKLEAEAKQLGLMIWWCGRIEGTDLFKEGYLGDESGAFSYSVKEGIDHLEFKVMEDEDVYCTGIAIQLPDNFVKSK